MNCRLFKCSDIWKLFSFRQMLIANWCMVLKSVQIEKLINLRLQQLLQGKTLIYGIDLGYITSLDIKIPFLEGKQKKNFILNYHLTLWNLVLFANFNVLFMGLNNLLLRGSLVWFVSCATLFMVSSNLSVLGLENLAVLFNPQG